MNTRHKSTSPAATPNLRHPNFLTFQHINVIHLSRAAQRKKTFLALNRIDGIHFELVEGVDSNSLDFAQLKRRNLIKSKTTFRTPGCSLAHRNLWLRSLETQTALIVCEDDAVIRQDFRAQFSKCLNALPTGWDFLLLGYNFDSFLDVEIIPGIESLSGRFTDMALTSSRLKNFQNSVTPISVLPLRNAFGTPAYAVSPSGAKFLLEHVFPLRNVPVPLPFEKRAMVSYSMDAIMNRFYRKMKAFACLPPLVVSPNKKDPNARIVRID
ncbi:MAG TPA: glycosyltransferase family 25 protein [Verrucomicrobiae bacterium]|jgi:GR25 family glycosyltransferase involved in LPS biosynthesis